MKKIQELEQLALSLPDNAGLKAPLLRFIAAFHTKSLIQHFVENARRLGHGSHVVAASAYWTGLRAYSLCCGCADKVAGKALRLPLGGECDQCPYVGYDCLVIIPDELMPTNQQRMSEGLTADMLRVFDVAVDNQTGK